MQHRVILQTFQIGRELVLPVNVHKKSPVLLQNHVCNDCNCGV